MTGLELLKAPEATAGEIADIISAPCPPTIPAHCDGVSCRECWLTWLTGELIKEKGPSDEQTAPCGGCPLQGKKRELMVMPQKFSLSCGCAAAICESCCKAAMRVFCFWISSGKVLSSLSSRRYF